VTQHVPHDLHRLILYYLKNYAKDSWSVFAALKHERVLSQRVFSYSNEVRGGVSAVLPFLDTPLLGEWSNLHFERVLHSSSG
jgi:hypothetical protein